MSLIRAFQTGKHSDFSSIIVGTPGGGPNSKLNGPQVALAFDLEGLDSHATVIPAAPTIASAQTAAEQVEHYWGSLLIDVPFADYDTNADVAAAVADMNSEPGEDKVAFLQRVRRELARYSERQTHEACAEICSDGKVDVAGVVDDTQVDGVLYQWRLNGNASWKVPALRRFLEMAGFAGKPSTRWSPDTVHDFMHAKITVADDISFIGSFNLSHSGEMNAENVLEIRDAAIADRLAAFVDEIRALYPPVTLPENTTILPVESQV